MQLEELVGDVPAEKLAVLADYHVDSAMEIGELLTALASLPYHGLLEAEVLIQLLGHPATVNPLDHAVAPRGYRVLSHIPRVPTGVIERVVRDLNGLETIVRASTRELEAVEGVGSVRAREIKEGLRRLQEHNLVDRYLQL